MKTFVRLECKIFIESKKENIIMIHKRNKVKSGIRATAIQYTERVKPIQTRQNQAEIDFCQHCQKPASQCKGNCNIKKEMEKQNGEQN